MSTTVTQQPQHSTLGEYKRWLRVSLYTILLLTGQCTATLLGRFYFAKGGKSKWIATSVQSAGFPILIPLLFYSSKSTNHDFSKPKRSVMITFYLGFGLLMIAMDFLYSCGLSYLSLSTFALVCATQLAFNGVATYFLNSQKFTALILNSIVVLTMSVILIALNTESEDSTDLPKEKRLIGLFCALAASATFALQHSLLQFYFEKVAKTGVFSVLLRLNFYPMIIASVGAVVGLLGSGDWRSMGMEMKEFEYGNLELTITPILAVFVFHDKIYAVKIVAFFLAIWGFLSYIYQHYLDDQMANQDRSDDGLQVLKGEEQI